jgi:imidazolonepropionase-like amidohydrolase
MRGCTFGTHHWRRLLGAIAAGMEADIIATVGNPLDDITSVRRMVSVMKGGQVYKNDGTRR